MEKAWRKCMVCGLSARTPRAKYCADCFRERRKQYQREYQREYRKIEEHAEYDRQRAKAYHKTEKGRAVVRAAVKKYMETEHGRKKRAENAAKHCRLKKRMQKNRSRRKEA